MNDGFKFIYLLDNNLFRMFCTSKKGKAIINFNKSIDNYSFFREQTGTAFKMTPFSLLEAIGIVPPKVPIINLPQEVINTKKATVVADYLLKNSLTYYRHCEELSEKNILLKVEEQKKYITHESAELFEGVVSKPTKDKNFIEYIYKQLNMDFLLKYEYPQELMQIMTSFWGAQLFFNNTVSINISKFRLAKKLWDVLYNKLYQERKVTSELLELVQKAMKLKKHQDYLDSELIHFACFGDYIENANYPIACFTLDPPEVIIPRLSVYKGIIEVFKISMVESNPSVSNLPTIEMKEGLFCFCDDAGFIYKVIEIEDVKVMV